MMRASEVRRFYGTFWVDAVSILFKIGCDSMQPAARTLKESDRDICSREYEDKAR